MRRVFMDLAEYTRSLQPLMDNGVRYSRCALLDACIKYPIRFSFSPRFLPSAARSNFLPLYNWQKTWFTGGRGGCWKCPLLLRVRRHLNTATAEIIWSVSTSLKSPQMLNYCRKTFEIWPSPDLHLIWPGGWAIQIKYNSILVFSLSFIKPTRVEIVDDWSFIPQILPW